MQHNNGINTPHGQLMDRIVEQNSSLRYFDIKIEPTSIKKMGKDLHTLVAADTYALSAVCISTVSVALSELRLIEVWLPRFHSILRIFGSDF